MALYDYEAFMKDIFKLTKIDLTFYKQAQMQRRIDTHIGKSPYKDYQEYAGALAKDKKMLDEFLEKGAISKAQHDKSLHDLTEKMRII